MNAGGKRILQLALQQKHDSDEDESLHDPYSDYSDEDQAYIPSGSSDDHESDSDDEIGHVRAIEPGSSQATKRCRILSESDDSDEETCGERVEETISESDEGERRIGIGDEDENEEHGVEYNQEQGGQQVQRDLSQSVWTAPGGNHLLQFDETFEAGIKPEWHAALGGQDPVDYYFALVNFDIIDEIVNQTNLYATQLALTNTTITNYVRLQNWEPTNRAEIIHLIGLLGYMGIVHMSSLRYYWSTKWILKTDIARNVMSRNRFEILLKMLHFSDNDQCPEGNRLYKVQPLFDMLIKNYQSMYTPGKTFCIDETMVPFQDRLSFRQYNPQKTHKYGIKLFKVCCDNGYTWNISIYSGQEKAADKSLSVSTKIVLNLAKELLQSGRTCVIDNWYTSLQLAHILLDGKIHCLGTLRANRKGNPTEVVKKKLKKGEVFAQENERGICVLKWRDRWDVLILSTCHTDETIGIQRRGNPVQKPKAIVDYNSGKSSIDVSDQMSSYSTALRKTIRWYKKLAVELLLGTSVVNSHFIFKLVEQSDMSITDFRLSVVEGLLKFQDTQNITHRPSTSQSLRTHTFTKLDGKARENRRYCRGCYKKKTEGIIDKNKVRKVTTYCQNCEGNPRFCLDCFNDFHRK